MASVAEVRDMLTRTYGDQEMFISDSAAEMLGRFDLNSVEDLPPDEARMLIDAFGRGAGFGGPEESRGPVNIDNTDMRRALGEVQEAVRRHGVKNMSLASISILRNCECWPFPDPDGDGW